MGCCSSKRRRGRHDALLPTAAARQSAEFSKISDEYTTLAQVQEALRKAGLESSNIIVAVDFTKSNEWAGAQSFNGLSLHHLGQRPNPYEQAIGAIARTLAAFDDDDLIPAYGFGDVSTRDSGLFSFKPGDTPCHGLTEVLARYRALVPAVKLAGPTSFAPAIRQAMRLVVESGCQYHILLLVADGQVTGLQEGGGRRGAHSAQEAATIQAIVDASVLPLSIVMVGVGDGPWDLMHQFDDDLPQRVFDNFQFVDFTTLSRRYPPGETQEANFALAALMEVPQQFKAVQKLGLLGREAPPMASTPQPLPPPHTPGCNPLAVPSQTVGSCTAALLPPPAVPTPPTAPTIPHLPPLNPSPMATPAGRAQAYLAPEPSCSACTAVGAAAADGTVAPTSLVREASAKAQAAAAHGDAPAAHADAPDPMFLCPITQEVMAEPVVAADGYTYDGPAIRQWLATHSTSPMTNTPLPHTNLTPNHALRSSVLEWQARRPRSERCAEVR